MGYDGQGPSESDKNVSMILGGFQGLGGVAQAAEAKNQREKPATGMQKYISRMILDKYADKVRTGQMSPEEAKARAVAEHLDQTGQPAGATPATGSVSGGVTGAAMGAAAGAAPPNPAGAPTNAGSGAFGAIASAMPRGGLAAPAPQYNMPPGQNAPPMEGSGGGVPPPRQASAGLSGGGDMPMPDFDKMTNEDYNDLVSASPVFAQHGLSLPEQMLLADRKADGRDRNIVTQGGETRKTEDVKQDGRIDLEGTRQLGREALAEQNNDAHMARVTAMTKAAGERQQRMLRQQFQMHQDKIKLGYAGLRTKMQMLETKINDLRTRAKDQNDLLALKIAMDTLNNIRNNQTRLANGLPSMVNSPNAAKQMKELQSQYQSLMTDEAAGLDMDSEGLDESLNNLQEIWQRLMVQGGAGQGNGNQMPQRGQTGYGTVLSPNGIPPTQQQAPQQSQGGYSSSTTRSSVTTPAGGVRDGRSWLERTRGSRGQ